VELHRDDVAGFDELFSAEMAQSLGELLEERAGQRAKAREADFDRVQRWYDAAHQPMRSRIEPAVEKANVATRDEVATFAHEVPPVPPTELPEGTQFLPAIASPHSCTPSNLGPYNSFGGTTGGGAGGIQLLNDPSRPRSIGGQVNLGFAGSGTVWGGAGCWFSLSPQPGVWSLKIGVIAAAHCYLGPPPPWGYSEGHLSFHGAVSWQNTTWVDFGGTGVDLHDGYAADVWRDGGISMTLTCPFNGSQGGLYYCFGWFSVSGSAGGFAACNVDIAAFMNPLRVCTPGS
jgi:hypothetical protein